MCEYKEDIEAVAVAAGVDFTMEIVTTFIYDPELTRWHKVDCSLRRPLTKWELDNGVDHREGEERMGFGKGA